MTDHSGGIWTATLIVVGACLLIGAAAGAGAVLLLGCGGC